MKSKSSRLHFETVTVNDETAFENTVDINAPEYMSDPLDVDSSITRYELNSWPETNTEIINNITGNNIFLNPNAEELQLINNNNTKRVSFSAFPNILTNNLTVLRSKEVSDENTPGNIITDIFSTSTRKNKKNNSILKHVLTKSANDFNIFPNNNIINNKLNSNIDKKRKRGRPKKKNLLTDVDYFKNYQPAVLEPAFNFLIHSEESLLKPKNLKEIPVNVSSDETPSEKKKIVVKIKLKSPKSKSKTVTVDQKQYKLKILKNKPGIKLKYLNKQIVNTNKAASTYIDPKYLKQLKTKKVVRVSLIKLEDMKKYKNKIITKPKKLCVTLTKLEFQRNCPEHIKKQLSKTNKANTKNNVKKNCNNKNKTLERNIQLSKNKMIFKEINNALRKTRSCLNKSTELDSCNTSLKKRILDKYNKTQNK